MTRIAIVKYGVGNIYSVRAGLERQGASPVVVSSLGEAARSNIDALVFPGVGAYPAASRRILGEREELAKLLENGVPVLGICLGMQLFFEESEEGGKGLGLLRGRVERLEAPKLPHIGWTRVRIIGESELLEGVPDNTYMYFVHSYAYKNTEAPWVRAIASYGEDFAAVVEEPPLYGTQFHPERSGRHGSRVLGNFVRLVRR